MNIGNAIQTLRKKQGLNQLELAEKCGITQAALSRIENGIKKPGSTTLDKLCKELKTSKSLIYLIAIEGDDVPEENRDAFDKLFPSIQKLVYKIIDSK